MDSTKRDNCKIPCSNFTSSMSSTLICNSCGFLLYTHPSLTQNSESSMKVVDLHSRPLPTQKRDGDVESAQNENSLSLHLPEQENFSTENNFYSWIPPGLEKEKVDEYMSQLPNNKIPFLNSAGDEYRSKQLSVQIPQQDLCEFSCKFLYREGDNVEKKLAIHLFRDLIFRRNTNSLDVGYVTSQFSTSLSCSLCDGEIGCREIGVQSPKLTSKFAWHPACFVCVVCAELLVDLCHCVFQEELYCVRHYDEIYKPRCASCDELIFTGEYTKAMNKNWHKEHFACNNCKEVLTGKRFIQKEEKQYCLKCYDDMFANICFTCNKPIGTDSKDLSYKDNHWHEDCFKCSKCGIKLANKYFASKDDRLFCGPCYETSFSSKCHECKQPFKPGSKKMEYKGKYWHESCFCCSSCKVAIGTLSFIPKDDLRYCTNCYQEKFSTKCIKCGKVITVGGVTYKKGAYHKECFVCFNCASPLGGQRFTAREDRTYCSTCYTDLFSKVCSSCKNIITGSGGTKYITFESRHWHNDCFKCTTCQKSLVGKGFITDESSVLCPECAKAKLQSQFLVS